MKTTVATVPVARRHHVDAFTLTRADELLTKRKLRIKPGEPIADLIGPQYSAREIAAAYEHHHDEPWSRRIASKVREFPVPGLVGARFPCRPDEFHIRLDEVLSSALPGTTWNTGSMYRYGPGLIEKYGLLDGSYAAPWDTETGRTMVLSLAGGRPNTGAGLGADAAVG